MFDHSYSLDSQKHSYPEQWSYSSKQIYAPKAGRLVGSIFSVNALDHVHVFFAQLKVKNFKILF